MQLLCIIILHSAGCIFSVHFCLILPNYFTRILCISFFKFKCRLLKFSEMMQLWWSLATDHSRSCNFYTPRSFYSKCVVFYCLPTNQKVVNPWHMLGPKTPRSSDLFAALARDVLQDYRWKEAREKKTPAKSPSLDPSCCPTLWGGLKNAVQVVSAFRFISSRKRNYMSFVCLTNIYSTSSGKLQALPCSLWWKGHIRGVPIHYFLCVLSTSVFFVIHSKIISSFQSQAARNARHRRHMKLSKRTPKKSMNLLWYPFASQI